MSLTVVGYLGVTTLHARCYKLPPRRVGIGLADAPPGGPMKRAVLLIGIALAIPHHANAQVAEPTRCSTLPHVLYLQVGDTQVNLLKRLGRALRDNTAQPIALAFFTSGSCVNIANFYAGGALPKSTTFQYVPSQAEDAAWDADNPLHSATLACVPDDA